VPPRENLEGPLGRTRKLYSGLRKALKYPEPPRAVLSTGGSAWVDHCLSESRANPHPQQRDSEHDPLLHFFFPPAFTPLLAFFTAFATAYFYGFPERMNSLMFSLTTFLDFPFFNDTLTHPLKLCCHRISEYRKYFSQ
jgi:hypothetical protein